ncbi:hypothetical protein NM688_g6228 [Phlebia brevispora]|uniref:Uncharacterized protein n=1 Tax=Phlebia brevispora TaxID=194682 RepID=A0ACC1SID4_9APHY|nr:hypothetical protein NM688_g6228 [Phlebia brevispora]
MADISAEHDLNYAAVVAIAFMTWDALIHIGAEVNGESDLHLSMADPSLRYNVYGPVAIHGSNGSTLSFVIVLYSMEPLTLYGHLLQPKLCRTWLIYQIAFMEALIVATETILTMRLYFLYHEYRIVKRIILLVFALEIVAMNVVLCLSVPKIFTSAKCVITETPNILMAYWISFLVFEAFLFSLTLFAFFKFRSVIRGLGRKSILFLFVRDGTWAFAMMFGKYDAIRHLIFALIAAYDSFLSLGTDDYVRI